MEGSNKGRNERVKECWKEDMMEGTMRRKEQLNQCNEEQKEQQDDFGHANKKWQ